MDDGIGGADLDRGSGLYGLRDRVETLDGKLRIESELKRHARESRASGAGVGELPRRRGVVTLTFFFSDIEDSSGLAERLGGGYRRCSPRPGSCSAARSPRAGGREVDCPR